VSQPSKRTGSVVLGIVSIIVSVLWTLLWGAVALAGAAFGSDTQGWVIVSVALAFGLLGFVGGVAIVRGRSLSRWAWVGVAAGLLALLALPLASWAEDRAASPVNHAVEQAYMKGSLLTNVEADCDKINENPDGSEDWDCALSSPTETDICSAEVRRREGSVTVDVYNCIISGRFQR
jgi:hypothetical protein